MAELFKMPRLGQSMEEGTVLRWFKNEGETVKIGEPLLEVMSDKANFEVESTFSGVLRRILVPADGTVPVNVSIAIIGSADEPIDSLFSGEVATAQTAVVSAQPIVASQSPPSVSSNNDKVAISPRARRLADEKGVPVTALAGRGSGPQGRVLERDVVAYVDRAAALVDPQRSETGKPRATPLAARVAGDLGIDIGDLSLGLPGSRVTAETVRQHAKAAQPSVGEPAIAQVIPLRGLRKIIADNVTRSRQTAPHVTLTLEVDMSGIVAQFIQLREEIEKRNAVKLTYNDILVKAAAKAIADHPLCNAALIGEEIRVYDDINVGIAVAAPAGLIVPVVRQADVRSLGEVAVELKGLIERCRSGKQSSDDLSGGTFTITNLGAYGIDVFDPIIVSPQSCILGVGRIAEKPVVVAGQVVVRSMMNLCLSFDHRVVDGAPAAEFLRRVKTVLEAPLLAFI